MFHGQKGRLCQMVLVSVPSLLYLITGKKSTLFLGVRNLQRINFIKYGSYRGWNLQRVQIPRPYDPPKKSFIDSIYRYLFGEIIWSCTMRATQLKTRVFPLGGYRPIVPEVTFCTIGRGSAKRRECRIRFETRIRIRHGTISMYIVSPFADKSALGCPNLCSDVP